MDYVWAAAAFALMGTLAWIGFRIEPHWVARDGRRFLCVGQQLDTQGNATTRWRETRVMFADRGQLRLDQKKLFRHATTYWTVAAESPEPPRNKSVFLLKGHDNEGADAMFALRLPEKSRAVELLRPLMGRSG